jgi:hypothetical protein
MVLVEELLALLRAEPARYLAARQGHEVAEIHNVYAARTDAAGGCQAVAIGTPGHAIDRRRRGPKASAAARP